jgi:GxxExxY protein
MEINKITGLIVDRAIKIHREIGPGCYEKVYEELLHYELIKDGLYIQRQLLLPIQYDELFIKDAYKLDLFIENKIIVEIKSVENLLPVHYKQVMTYLKLLNIKNGILLNFKVEMMKDGVYRVFNNNGI